MFLTYEYVAIILKLFYKFLSRHFEIPTEIITAGWQYFKFNGKDFSASDEILLLKLSIDKWIKWSIKMMMQMHHIYSCNGICA